jgi:transposase InsO family protein
LEQFNFKLEHLPGTQMVQSDALSRRPDHHPDEEEEHQTQTLLGPDRFIAAIKFDTEGLYDANLQKEIAQNPNLNHEAKEIKENFSEPNTLTSHLIAKGWTRKSTREGFLLLYQGRTYVPEDVKLRRKIVHLYHDTPTAGHPGEQATKLALQKDYYWPGMTQFVNNYVKGCASCQQYKINRRPTNPALFPIEGSREPRPFSQCSMDLITDLPTSRGYDSILVIVDHGLTKGVILTPCTKNIDTEQVGDILFQKLLTKYGRPNKMISDRGPQFVSNSMTTALELMGIKSSPSTAFHPQTDGATERVNQEIQAYLSIFCTVNPETWAEKLPMVEFTHNSRNHADRQYSPFELLYGYQPPAIPTALGETNLPAVEKRMKMLDSARNEALAAHELSRARMRARYPNSFRTFKKGEKVWLEAKNLKLPYLSKKIAPKRTGPFKITEVISPITYRLALPKGWRIHPVFHSSLLTPFTTTDTHGPAFPTPIPDIIEGEEEYEVEGILKHKRIRGKTHLLVRWKDQPTTEDSWEPEEHLTHAKEALADYWARTEEFNRRKARRKNNKRREQEVPLVTRIRLLSLHMEDIRENKEPKLSQPFKSKTSTAVRLARLHTALSAEVKKTQRNCSALLRLTPLLRTRR